MASNVFCWSSFVPTLLEALEESDSDVVEFREAALTGCEPEVQVNMGFVPDTCPKRVSFLSEKAEVHEPASTSTQSLSAVPRSTRDPIIKISKTDAMIRKQHKVQLQKSLRLLDFLEQNRFKQANVNCKKTSTWGLSHTYPLHEAAKQNDKYIVRWLLRFGANPSNKDSKGQTALDIVKTLPTHREVCQILQEGGTKSSQILLRGFRQFMKDVEQHDPLAKGRVQQAS